jgi:hypothetical protein
MNLSRFNSNYKSCGREVIFEIVKEPKMEKDLDEEENLVDANLNYYGGDPSLVSCIMRLFNQICGCKK